ncbi:MAG: response regulator, partial [Alphaproteobacteria bacterium]|nr:response regulator [Alphaproteobacteria bacterium]
GIIGTTELLLESHLNNQQRAQATTAMTSAEALLHLINDILDFSKIESGKLELEACPFDLMSLAEDVAELLAPKARHKMLDLLMRYASGTPRFVVGDSARLRQILLNLVGNAIKFTETGHVQITVEAAAAGEGGRVLKFSVTDTGIGIAKDKQALIFERFAQADGSMSRRYGGTGLGLSICKELISLMGGSLQVESAVGHGSTFWFAIPLAQAPSAAVTNASDATILEDLKLLIVDDTEASRSLLSEQLEGAGRSCAAVDGGRQALEVMSQARAEGKPFDIVILDHMMPGMDGIELAGYIRQDPNYQDTVLVLLSSSAAFEATPAIHDKGIGAFMIKPTRKSQLLDTLASLQQAKADGHAVDQLRQVAHGSSAPERRAEESLSGLHVLLVEDNRINRELAKQVLTNLSCEVTTAEHGQEAVALATEASFDVILMDCQMPVMDGFEASRLIKAMIADGEIAYVPIVALTANAMKGDRERCLEAGMDDYSTKPVRKKDLIDILTRWCVVRENLAAQQAAQVLPAPVEPPPAVESVAAPDASAAAAPEIPTIDQASLDDMRDVMGDQFKVILEYYLDDAANYLKEIRGGWQASDGKAIAAAAHPLKSSSRELGVFELSDIAKCIEENARQADGDDSKIPSIGPLVDQLDACFDKARSELQAILEEAA